MTSRKHDWSNKKVMKPGDVKMTPGNQRTHYLEDIIWFPEHGTNDVAHAKPGNQGIGRCQVRTLILSHSRGEE